MRPSFASCRGDRPNLNVGFVSPPIGQALAGGALHDQLRAVQIVEAELLAVSTRSLLYGQDNELIAQRAHRVGVVEDPTSAPTLS